VRCEKTIDVIYHRFPDAVVGTPFAAAGVDHIPERDAVQAKLINPVCVGEVAIDKKECIYDLPEMVPGIPVVLGPQKRLPARKTAEDKNCRRIANRRVESGTAFRERGYVCRIHRRAFEIKKGQGFSLFRVF
jgi:hypothetical protein